MKWNRKCKVKKSWIKAELDEHGHLFKKGRKIKMAKKIAIDHVKELGCGYYPELLKMERRLKKK